MRLIGWLLIGATSIILGHGHGHTTSITDSANVASPPAGATEPVLVLVQDEPTAVNGYPGPSETPPAGSEAYPAPAGTVASYPAATAGADSSPTPIPIIGEETAASTAPEAAANGRQINTPQALRGRLFLWGGFIVALFLFITGVTGSIVLFMRRRG